MRSGAADGVRRGLRLLVLLAGTASPVFAQNASLRVGGAIVPGTTIDGAAAFPVRTLESLGFVVTTAPDGAVAILGTDTLRFFTTSPFFHVGAQVHQLAFPPREHDGAVHLPEQFFIQWLPNAYPDRYAFRQGALVVRIGSTRTVARTAAPRETPASAPSAARRLVVIDPGHGGRDPGRIGPRGLQEKDVALAISQQLARILAERGYEVRLTRTADTYVALSDRPKLANEWKADRPVAVFLSIHANAARSGAARGFETFFLSDAQTEDERRVAEMENESLRFDAPGPSAASGLDHILTTLRSDFLMRASHDLANVVQQRLAGFHPGPNRGVKRAGFIVLIGAVMPAVLVETAFISNREEARMLGTRSFQDRIARAIAEGVDEFFQRNEHLWVSESR